MHSPTLPLSRDLVMIGGGHTHALVLRVWGMNPLPGVRVTLINPGPTAPYSGMLPGHLAGHYPRAALDIDLVRLARFAGARLVLGAVDGIDLQARTISIPGRAPIGFDVASVDVGITSAMPALPGFAQHAVPAKPLGPFASAWARFLDGKGPATVAVIGAGVAGAEIAMALAFALKSKGRAAQVTLIDRSNALSALRSKTANALRAALADQEVTLIEQAAIAAVTAEGVQLEDGSVIEAAFVTGAAGAKPHDWIAGTGLDLEGGFIRVDDRLRSSDGSVFAVGDCAHMSASPRPKAGVFAVRQAPTLLNNLRATLSDAGGLKPYVPQRDYLKLISLGKKSALADRFGLKLSGPLLWKWKDRIDQAFMEKFRTLPQMPPPDLPWPRASGSREVLGDKPMCGGCGAKVGSPALIAALGDRDAPGDDAAILQTGQTRQVISTDHLRAMTEDAYVLAKIAAVHALGDVWAMGAKPQAATINVILPRQSETLAQRSLREITMASRAVLGDAGAELVGGHTTQGSELTIGFTVTGLCAKPPITLTGARPGDHLILTKPIGSGVVMAAEMAKLASGETVENALNTMMMPQGQAAEILSAAQAMTDVTGFGLAGHIANICAGSAVGAQIDLDAVPLIAGAEALAEAGVRSSLFPINRAAVHISAPDPEDPRLDLMFDPQTGGGLLAAIRGETAPILQALAEAGYEAAQIGALTEDAGQISIA
ncbi:selenide, water dikinase SelD [Thalassococcus lentus]|uniref:Selenide, water dikinase SelD n=1 Tax=Thalassococcus lentus TaxID=1210524 RepID=A0ABT4XUS5_9RHOB|nr:selenide, water dikinase SelD [Thalassococcus lentus]MDA7425721.1 selenide, water dikinase SelD [Thalassococcus lentus]